MSSLSLAKHVHFGELQVQFSIHGGMGLSWGVFTVLLFVPTLVSVNCPNVCVHD